ncbi:MAG: 3-deoxy-7-phosphoheptulonate synthase [Alphaproteobacteria bacterium]|nr:3-deoxy-7-phosphoheptulonate synthase [Alphaproteobacteria bacterium]
MSWTPDSWRSRPIEQQPEYPDAGALEAALERVRALPPLVAPSEVDALREKLGRAGRGEAFVLQGGDCAERFEDCARSPIERKLKILLQMSLVLTWGARIPVVRIGRIAGQYAKPRSNPTEIVDGIEVSSYRGEHVNGIDPSRRTPDPERMVTATYHSAATLNYIRALLDGGFADLHHPRRWDLGSFGGSARVPEYEAIVERMVDALDFVDATGVKGGDALRNVDLFTSHEGLLLAWEEAHTVEIDGRWYNLGAHFLWIGNRTRQLDGAHVEYMRGLANPIGVKVGPGMSPPDLVALLDRLDPDDTPGRITLISRFGAKAIAAGLPPLVDAVAATGRTVVWSCDPMHGNTTTTASGLKTRSMDDVLAELRVALEIHEARGRRLGGVHFELTGDDVTECTGGPQGLGEADLSRAYETYCDPRLNYAQSLELAFLLARRLGGRI